MLQFDTPRGPPEQNGCLRERGRHEPSEEIQKEGSGRKKFLYLIKDFGSFQNLGYSLGYNLTSGD